MVAELRETLARRHPDALPVAYRTAGAVSTGIAALDGVLPNGGLPRGRLVAWAPGGGATAVLRTACRTVVSRGERAVWVDGAGVLTSDFWDATRDPLLLRPAGEVEALACAEELLRSGGFALVVLSGVERGAGREAVRLSRAAKEGGGAFVAVTVEATVAHLRVSTRVAADGYAWRANPFGEAVDALSARVEVEASSMGWSDRVSFRLPVHVRGARLALDPMLVDRRGVKRSSRRKRGGQSAAGRSSGGASAEPARAQVAIRKPRPVPATQEAGVSVPQEAVADTRNPGTPAAGKGKENRSFRAPAARGWGSAASRRAAPGR